MFDSFFVALNAVIPFLCYLLLGYASNAAGVVDEAFLNRLTKLIFTIMFPFMTFYNVYKAEPGNMPSPALMTFCGAAILAVQAVLLLIVPRLVKENRRRGVIIQAVYRSNFVLFGLPLTASIFGAEKTSIAAMLVTVVITIYNITSVIILELFNDEGTHRIALRPLLVKLAKNPMLQGCCVGLACYLLGLRLPSALEKPISEFADMSSPLALFALGGTLQFKAIGKNLRYLVPTLATKLILLPLALVAIAYALGLRGVELFLVIAVFATPVASGSYPMAQNMGGDGELAGQLVFLSTVISVFTLFGWIFVLRLMCII